MRWFGMNSKKISPNQDHSNCTKYFCIYDYEKIVDDNHKIKLKQVESLSRPHTLL